MKFLTAFLLLSHFVYAHEKLALGNAEPQKAPGGMINPVDEIEMGFVPEIPQWMKESNKCHVVLVFHNATVIYVYGNPKHTITLSSPGARNMFHTMITGHPEYNRIQVDKDYPDIRTTGPKDLEKAFKDSQILSKEEAEKARKEHPEKIQCDK